jgi:hypothetical protein
MHLFNAEASKLVDHRPMVDAVFQGLNCSILLVLPCCTNAQGAVAHRHKNSSFESSPSCGHLEAARSIRPCASRPSLRQEPSPCQRHIYQRQLGKGRSAVDKLRSRSKSEEGRQLYGLKAPGEMPTARHPPSRKTDSGWEAFRWRRLGFRSRLQGR